MAIKPTIDYETLAREALRGVVKAVLQKVAAQGLPGEHHFYVSFATGAAGVTLSKRLRERYPEEMTIVLQHRFWDLLVGDDKFEVKLTFDGIPERIVIPFAAIKVFVDPSVRFVLPFEAPQGGDDGSADPASLTMDAAFDAVGSALADAPPAAVPKRPRAARNKPKVEKDAAATLKNGADDRGAAKKTPPPATLKTIPPALPGEGRANEKSANADEPQPAVGSAQIVSLDAFRKK